MLIFYLKLSIKKYSYNYEEWIIKRRIKNMKKYKSLKYKHWNEKKHFFTQLLYFFLLFSTPQLIYIKNDYKCIMLNKNSCM